jgi:hypothetical protein
VVQLALDWQAEHAVCSMDVAWNRRILLQGQVRPELYGTERSRLDDYQFVASRPADREILRAATHAPRLNHRDGSKTTMVAHIFWEAAARKGLCLLKNP